MTSGSIAVRLLGLLLLLPLALRLLPVEEANLWFLFSAVLGLQSLIDFGFSPTFIRFVAYCRSGSSADSAAPTGLPEVVRKPGASAIVVSTMRQIYARIGMVAFLLMAGGGSLAVAGPVSMLSSQWDGWLAWGVVCCTGSVALYGTMYSTYLQGAEAIALFRRWEILVGATSTVIAAIVLLAGGGLIGLVLATQAGAVLNVVVNRRLSRKVSHTGEWSGRSSVDHDVMQAIWPAAWRSGLGVLMTAGIIQGTGVMYAQLATAAESASYLLALRLVNTIRVFSNVPFYTKLPLMAKVYAAADFTKLKRIARTGMLRTNWLVVLGVAAVAVLGDEILRLLGSETPFVAAAVWALLGVGVLVERIGAMHIQLYSTTNHVVWHVANGTAGLIMLVAIPVAYHYWGLPGFPFGVLLGYTLFYVPYSIWHSYRAFRLTVTDMDLAASIMPLIVLVLALLGLEAAGAAIM